MLLSYIDGTFEGDTTFPEFHEGAWRIDRRERREGYELVVYQRTM